jgi:hypothetical protein
VPPYQYQEFMLSKFLMTFNTETLFLFNMTPLHSAHQLKQKKALYFEILATTDLDKWNNRSYISR